MSKKASVNKTTFDRPDENMTAVNTRADGLRQVSIHSTVTDRLAGASFIERIWGQETNLKVLQRVTVDPVVRDICQKYFLSRKLRRMMDSLIPVSKFKIPEKMFRTDEVFCKLSESVGHAEAATAVAEIVFPVLHKLGLIGDARTYTTRIVYPLVKVTSAQLAHDVMVEEVSRVAKNAHTNLQIRDGETYHRAAFAAAFAEAFVPVGAKLLETNELGSIIDDIVKGVRAHIDPELHGLRGAVPVSWSQNPVVVELATCFPFIMAAFAIPHGSSVALKNEHARLQEWSPIVLAALKSSSRYAIINANAAVSELTKRTVVDLEGTPQAFVLHRSAKPVAAAQTVQAIEDDYLRSAINLHDSRSPIDVQIAGSYVAPANMSTDAAASALTAALTHLVEAGFQPKRMGYVYDVGCANDISLLETVCLISQRVDVNMDALATETPTLMNVVGGVHYENWVFYMPTQFKHLHWSNTGVLLGDEYATSSVAEAMLVANDFTAKSTMPARPQLIAKAGLDTALLNFSIDDETISVADRIAYKFTAGQLAVHGRLPINALQSLRTNDAVRVVRPVFNIDVFDCVSDIFSDIDAIVDAYKKEDQRSTSSPVNPRVLDHVNRYMVRIVQTMAEGVSPALRAELEDRKSVV